MAIKVSLMTEVEFGDYDFRIAAKEDRKSIFDIVRKKWVALTPEEFVRQHVLHFLIEGLHFPASRIAVEKSFQLNNTNKRFDVALFDRNAQPLMLVECKAPDVAINASTIQQIANYNLKFPAAYWWLCNGGENIVYDVRNNGVLPQFPVEAFTGKETP